MARCLPLLRKGVCLSQTRGCGALVLLALIISYLYIIYLKKKEEEKNLTHAFLRFPRKLLRKLCCRLLWRLLGRLLWGLLQRLPALCLPQKLCHFLLKVLWGPLFGPFTNFVVQWPAEAPNERRAQRLQGLQGLALCLRRTLMLRGFTCRVGGIGSLRSAIVTLSLPRRRGRHA